MDMVFDTFPKKIYPFDFETYFQSDMVCEIVTTNCETGKAEYMTEQSDPDRLMKLCRASSSMPLLSPIVNIDGVPYLDGGLADSIPVKRALANGNDKIIVVLTAIRAIAKNRQPQELTALQKSLQKISESGAHSNQKEHDL